MTRLLPLVLCLLVMGCEPREPNARVDALNKCSEICGDRNVKASDLSSWGGVSCECFKPTPQAQEVAR